MAGGEKIQNLQNLERGAARNSPANAPTGRAGPELHTAQINHNCIHSKVLGKHPWARTWPRRIPDRNWESRCIECRSADRSLNLGDRGVGFRNLPERHRQAAARPRRDRESRCRATRRQARPIGRSWCRSLCHHPTGHRTMRRNASTPLEPASSRSAMLRPTKAGCKTGLSTLGFSRHPASE